MGLLKRTDTGVTDPFELPVSKYEVFKDNLFVDSPTARVGNWVSDKAANAFHEKIPTKDLLQKYPEKAETIKKFKEPVSTEYLDRVYERDLAKKYRDKNIEALTDQTMVRGDTIGAGLTVAAAGLLSEGLDPINYAMGNGVTKAIGKGMQSLKIYTAGKELGRLGKFAQLYGTDSQLIKRGLGAVDATVGNLITDGITFGAIDLKDDYQYDKYQLGMSVAAGMFMGSIFSPHGAKALDDMAIKKIELNEKVDPTTKLFKDEVISDAIENVKEEPRIHDPEVVFSKDKLDEGSVETKVDTPDEKVKSNEPDEVKSSELTKPTREQEVISHEKRLSEAMAEAPKGRVNVKFKRKITDALFPYNDKNPVKLAGIDYDTNIYTSFDGEAKIVPLIVKQNKKGPYVEYGLMDKNGLSMLDGEGKPILGGKRELGYKYYKNKTSESTKQKLVEKIATDYSFVRTEVDDVVNTASNMAMTSPVPVDRVKLEHALVAKYVKDINSKELASLESLTTRSTVQQHKYEVLKYRMENYDFSILDDFKDILSGKDVDDRIYAAYKASIGGATGKKSLDDVVGKLAADAPNPEIKKKIVKSLEDHKERLKKIKKEVTDCLTGDK